jgi:3-oxoacyl-[acyl-carrier protein] reductase
MNVLVTGCSRGLGISICSNLLSQGYNVYGVSRTITPELDKLLKKFPTTFYFKKFDLEFTHKIQQELFKDWLINSNISIDAFINNAAIAYDDIISNANLDRLERMFRVNVFSPIMLTKYVIRNFLLNNVQGSIIHISSISVHTGYKGLSMYASTKGALEAFSKNTAREWGNKGVRSNCIVAGFMETEMSQSLSDIQKEKIYNRTSLRMPTDKNSVSACISFLISENSKSITGQNIFIDSGTI